MTGIAEWDGSIYNSKGIDIEDLHNYKMSKKGIKGYPRAEEVITIYNINNDQMLIAFFLFLY